MFKLAYCAGHDLNTPGKRLPAFLDPAQTREWTLNDRVARHLAAAAAAYPDLRLLRTDDPTGRTYIPIADRCARANAWGADLYLDIHHNAGIGGGTGGGIELYSYPGSAPGRSFRNALYEQLLLAGGLKGNRARPLREKAFDSLKCTAMPAVLAECGFMDSRTDAPVILTEDYARRMGEGMVAAIAQVAGLTRTPPEEGDFVRQIQSLIGAEVDGIVGKETLGKTPTVSQTKNRRHPVVAPIQRRLTELGYRQVGEADGIAGPKFTAAVQAFQRSHGCIPDGELTTGCKTWKTLLTL